MRTFRAVVPILAVNLLALCSTFAQQAVPPPPKPADSGPSLAVTMQFIQERVNSIGAVNWIALPDQEHATEVTIPSIEPSSCTLTFRLQEPSLNVDRTESLSLADIEDVTVEPWEQFIDRVSGAYVTGTQPPTLYLELNRPKKRGHIGLFFQDASLADRVARAITHAVELCGGGNKEPF